MNVKKTGTGKKPPGKLNINKQSQKDDAQTAANEAAAANVNLENHAMTINGKTYEVNTMDFAEQFIIGRGQYGVVSRVRHVPSNTRVAVKKIQLNTDPRETRRAITDLKVSMSAQSPYCVKFYGFLVAEGDIWICMELMDSSLDRLYPPIFRAGGYIEEPVLGKIAYSVVMALHYLHKQLGVVHRDVKPSNILVNSEGEIKMCDYGISGKLQNSMAKTQDVGCKPYMAPERINPEARSEEGYGVQSDVWSLGITLVEIAIGQHPFPFTDMFKQLNIVVRGDPPKLPDGDPRFSDSIRDFISLCVRKDYKQRPKYDKLCQHPFLVTASTADVDMRRWAREALQLLNSNATGNGILPATVPLSPTSPTAALAAALPVLTLAAIAAPMQTAPTTLPSVQTTATTMPTPNDIKVRDSVLQNQINHVDVSVAALDVSSSLDVAIPLNTSSQVNSTVNGDRTAVASL